MLSLNMISHINKFRKGVLMRFVFDILYILFAIAISPLLLYRMLRFGRYRQGWDNRFGKIARKNPAKKCIWIHAVSMGEVNATKTLVDELAKQLPHFELVISSTTDTGFQRANNLYGEKFTVFYFPLDFSFIMARALKNLRPALCLLMELEVWPNLVSIAHQQKIPVVVVNGRISDNSFPKYQFFRPVVKRIFRKTALILAQTKEYAERFIRLGADENNVIVSGSLKYDTAQIADRVEGSDQLAAKLNIKQNDRLFVAGGTGPGEEGIILDVYKTIITQERFKDVRLAIVPRKPERFDEVAQLIEMAPLPLIRYSKIKNEQNNPKIDSDTVILGDTMGDLRKFYSLAAIIFVGRSLVPMGGSDMAEAAALGKCTIFGPHTFNFNQTVDDLLTDNGAIQIKNEQELLEVIQKCLEDSQLAKKIAQNGQNVIRKNQGATRKTVQLIKGLLKK